jgi:hypothetical protein
MALQRWKWFVRIRTMAVHDVCLLHEKGAREVA